MQEFIFEVWRPLKLGGFLYGVLKKGNDRLEEDDGYWKRVIGADQIELELFGYRYGLEKTGQRTSPQEPLPWVH